MGQNTDLEKACSENMPFDRSLITLTGNTWVVKELILYE
jgi:hypothetical protein